MKIGLSYMTQIRSLLIRNPNPEQIASLTLEERVAKTGGGWIAQQIQELVSQISSAYGTEHNDDDTHSTIHASGSISEYGRGTAQGVWITVPYAAITFSATGGATWTVDASDLSGVGLAYTIIGKTMTVAWNFQSTTIASAPATHLSFMFSNTITPTRQIFGVGHCSNAATSGLCVCQVIPPGLGTGLAIQLDIINATFTWPISANATDVRGQMSFEIAGV